MPLTSLFKMRNFCCPIVINSFLVTLELRRSGYVVQTSPDIDGLVCNFCRVADLACSEVVLYKLFRFTC